MKKCQVCKHRIQEAEGVQVKTDGLLGRTYFHTYCFDDMWQTFLDRQCKDEQPGRCIDLKRLGVLLANFAHEITFEEALNMDDINKLTKSFKKQIKELNGEQ